MDLNENRLLCFIVVDDAVAKEISSQAGEAFLRGFVLQNRKTGKVWACYRFRYDDERRNWYRLDPHPEKKLQGAQSELEVGIAKAFRLAARAQTGRDIEVSSFYPPDDHGDPIKTLDWLRKMDLIHRPRKLEVQQSDKKEGP